MSPQLSSGPLARESCIVQNMKSFIRVFFILVIVTSLSCDHSTDVQNSNNDILFESSFESSGQPSLSGWRDGASYYDTPPTKYSFTNDVPPNSGVWSIKLEHPDISGSRLMCTVKPFRVDDTTRFRLTYWLKDTFQATSYHIFFAVFSDSNIYFAPGDRLSPPTWVHDTVTYFSTLRKIDSLMIGIDMEAPTNFKDSSYYIFVDHFKLEQL